MNDIGDNFTIRFDKLFLIFIDTMRDGVHYCKLKKIVLLSHFNKCPSSGNR